MDPGGGNQEIFYILAVNGPDLVTIHGTAAAGHPGESYEIRRAYTGATGLQAWESARDGDLVLENRTEVGVAYDDGPAFTGVVTIDTLSSNATNYMHLAVAKGHGHKGLAGTGVLLDGLGGTNGINVLEDFTRIEGFELEDHTLERAILLSPGVTNVVLDRLLIHDADFGIKAEGGSNFTLRNSIFYDSLEAVHDEGTTALIENCTVYNMTVDGGVKEDIGTYTVINTIAMDNTGDDFKDVTTQINNMSSDATAVGFPGRSSALQFVSTAARNFHLISGSEAIDNAGTRSFCCDVDGESRSSGIWDIGADEFNPSNTIYRSIGNAADYVAGTIVATDGWPVVYGIGTAWRVNNRGRGDRIQINASDYTILSVDTNTQLTLTAPVSGGNYAGGYTISRQFTGLASALSDWENCIEANGAFCNFFPPASPSLVADDRSEVGIVYDDGVFTAGFNLDGPITDASHVITLTADDGNRHYGIPGNGAVINVPGVTAINARVDFVTIEWLEIDDGSRGIVFDFIGATNKQVVRNNLIHGQLNEAVRIRDASQVIELCNNIVYNAGDGIHFGQAVTQGDIFNNTTFNNGRGISGRDGTGPYPMVTLQNNIAYNNAVADFDFDPGGGPTITGASSNNLAGDGTGIPHSPAGGGIDTLQTAFALFQAPLANDFHIRTGSDAVNSGVDLSAFLTNDIDDGLRQTLWDIGADDLAVTTAVELVSFIAVREGDRVVVEWETASELDNLGFHLYRSTSAEGPFERLTAQPVPGLGTSPVGASYRYVNEGVATGKMYYYELEDIGTTGGTERHGPIAVTLGDASDESEQQARTQIAYGTPEENALRIVKRTANYVVIELKTSGFFAEPLDDGSGEAERPGLRRGGRASGEPRVGRRDRRSGRRLETRVDAGRARVLEPATWCYRCRAGRHRGWGRAASPEGTKTHRSFDDTRRARGRRDSGRAEESSRGALAVLLERQRAVDGHAALRASCVQEAGAAGENASGQKDLASDDTGGGALRVPASHTLQTTSLEPSRRERPLPRRRPHAVLRGRGRGCYL